MAISDEIFIIALGMIITYLVFYKKNKLFGNVAFAGCSIALMSFGTDNFSASIGLIMLLGSLINLVYDAVSKFKGA